MYLFSMEMNSSSNCPTKKSSSGGESLASKVALSISGIGLFLAHPRHSVFANLGDLRQSVFGLLEDSMLRATSVTERLPSIFGQRWPVAADVLPGRHDVREFDLLDVLVLLHP